METLTPVVGIADNVACQIDMRPRVNDDKVGASNLFWRWKTGLDLMQEGMHDFDKPLPEEDRDWLASNVMMSISGEIRWTKHPNGIGSPHFGTTYTPSDRDKPEWFLMVNVDWPLRTLIYSIGWAWAMSSGVAWCYTMSTDFIEEMKWKDDCAHIQAEMFLKGAMAAGNLEEVMALLHPPVQQPLASTQIRQTGLHRHSRTIRQAA